jgi:hypothetical protein
MNQSNLDIQKEPISFYIPSELLERLEEQHFLIQRQLPREKRRRFSRSKLFELGLECVMNDYEEHKSDGVLWKKVTDWLKT